MTAATDLHRSDHWRSDLWYLVRRWRQLSLRLRDARFWLTQGMVLTIVAMHTVVEAAGSGAFLESFHHVPVILFVIPIVYAGLHFGWEGGALTAAWSALLTVPNLLLFHLDDYSWVGDLVGTVMVMVVGVVLGWRVERERNLRNDLEKYATQLLRAHEEERLRLARDIHDDTVQSLVLLCRGLDRVLDECEGCGQAEGIIRDLRGHATSAVDSSRRLCADLRPAILDDLGLAPGIQWLVRDLEERTGIRSTLEISGKTGRLDVDKELAIFRIAQEALRNIEKHSQATHVWGSLHFSRERIRMQIRDDGKGFDCQDAGFARDTEHFGRMGMRERARLMDGEVLIRSKPGTGTTVSVSVPR